MIPALHMSTLVPYFWWERISGRKEGGREGGRKENVIGGESISQHREGSVCSHRRQPAKWKEGETEGGREGRREDIPGAV